ncbi:MAG: 30S ribosomal protein S6 [Neomegalonema sp.]|nr:30S ribosomal protein S6 [Neomegalonema sp.]
MPLYEHIFIARQDLSNAQAEALIEEMTTIVAEQGGAVVNSEYWGLRSLAYKINKNRKGHYGFLRLDAAPAAIAELERRERFHDDVMRFVTFSVDEHEEGPSAIMAAKNSRDDRRGRGDRRDRGDRGDRDRGERGDRDRGERGDRDRGERGDRDRGERSERPEQERASEPAASE